MEKTCRACGYIRRPEDTSPDYECPKCGRVYAKVEAARSAPRRRPKTIASTDSSDGPQAGGSVFMAELKKPEVVRILAILVIAAAVILWVRHEIAESNRVEAQAQAVAQQRQADAERQRLARQDKLAKERAERERDPAYQARQRQIAKDAADRSLQVDVGSLCQVAIRSRLNDPGSAEFDFVMSYRWQRNPNNKVLMFPTLRAKNAFGGYVRASYACEVDVSNHKNMRILHLEQL